MRHTHARQRLAFALVTALALLGLVGRAAPDIVAVDGGRVAGTREADVRVFKGLPYAAPPVGELRWKPPQPVVPWTGVRDGAECGAEQYLEFRDPIRSGAHLFQAQLDFLESMQSRPAAGAPAR